MKAPNILSSKMPALPAIPAPLDLAEANSFQLLDALCIASQVQAMAPVPEIRRAYRARADPIHAELRKRLAPEIGK
jgi:hypothetical protein